jgi:hypothetical protein
MYTNLDALASDSLSYNTMMHHSPIKHHIHPCQTKAQQLLYGVCVGSELLPLTKRLDLELEPKPKRGLDSVASEGGERKAAYEREGQAQW